MKKDKMFVKGGSKHSKQPKPAEKPAETTEPTATVEVPKPEAEPEKPAEPAKTEEARVEDARLGAKSLGLEKGRPSRPMGIGAWCKAQIRDFPKKTNSQIANECSEVFGSNTTSDCVAWYRSRIRRDARDLAAETARKAQGLEMEVPKPAEAK